jgi:asparagine synthase (glutamine-hydrolysing)
MSYADNRYWIVYNGEVYNHVELRSELEAIGHGFKSHTDTEVILAAYAEWGTACLARLNGMFAFVLLDRSTGSVFAARDRFGVKPLYYWFTPEGVLAFASEPKQFTALPGWEARLNGQVAYEFLNWGVSDHTRETFFASVRQLRAGEAVQFTLNDLPRLAEERRLHPYAWYVLPDVRFAGSLEAAAERWRTLLAESVRLRLRADVPVGSCLSGGLDSSSIVCMVHSLLRDKATSAMQQTFSACSEDRRFDERHFVDAVTDRTSVAARHVYPTVEGLWGALDRITWHQDEPFGSTSIYAQWLVFALAHDHGVKVMLDGQGADEILGGYHGFFAPFLARLILGLRLGELRQELAALRNVHGYSGCWAIKQVMNAVLPAGLREPARRLVGKTHSGTHVIDLERLSAAPRDPFLDERGKRPSSMRELSVNQLTATNLQMLLHWEDRDSMAHSIEARVPFLDYRLVEFTLGLPDEYKIRDGLTKRVLRIALADMLPESVRARTDKLGFVTPEQAWMQEQDPQAFRTALSQAIEASSGIIRSHALRLYDTMVAGSRPFDHLVWRLISFGAWIRAFDVRL